MIDQQMESTVTEADVHCTKYTIADHSAMSRTKVLVAAGIVLVAAVTACGQKNVSSHQDVHDPVAAVAPCAPVSFRHDVYPILQEKCAICHAPGGPGYAKSGFSVQSYQTVMKGTKYGAVVIPGSGMSSTLVWLLEQGANPSIDMPKEYRVVVEGHKNIIIPSQHAWPLSLHQVELIQEWIDEGAKDN